MTYRKLFKLKFVQGYSTSELMQQFPNDLKRVSEVALLDVEDATLKSIIKEEGTVNRLIKLKKKLFKGGQATDQNKGKKTSG